MTVSIRWVILPVHCYYYIEYCNGNIGVFENRTEYQNIVLTVWARNILAFFVVKTYITTPKNV